MLGSNTMELKLYGDFHNWLIQLLNSAVVYLEVFTVAVGNDHYAD